jgi:hypothetical protein
LPSPIVSFIFDGKGPMYNLTLEGSKISRIHLEADTPSQGAESRVVAGGLQGPHRGGPPAI